MKEEPGTGGRKAGDRVRPACGSRGDRKAESGARRGGFSLVEVTLAIAIFAFVAVGILGLLPASLKQRADSSLETRAVMIAGELMASVQASPALTNLAVRIGPDLGNPSASLRSDVDLLAAPVVLGYPSATTVPFYLAPDPGQVWSNANANNPTLTTNTIDTLARLSATDVPGTPCLYRVSIEVRSPASASLRNAPPVVFTTLVYSP
jgi:prepilin-type N-terminal cleavage/methylation domain-containing protein